MSKGSPARKLRRAAAKGKGKQLQQKTSQLSDALSALDDMRGLQELVEGLKGVSEYVQQVETTVVETRQLVDALVDDYQAMVDEREREHKILCRVLARMAASNGPSAEGVQALFNEEAAALQAEDT